MPKQTYTFRPSKENALNIEKFLKSEKKRRHAASINNTIEAIISDYSNGYKWIDPITACFNSQTNKTNRK